MPPGTLLVCVSLDHWPDDIAVEDHVIAHQWRGGRVEVICREVAQHDGWLYLVPSSSDPIFTEKIKWRAAAAPAGISDAGASYTPAPGLGEPGKPGDGLHVVAVVVGDYRHKRRRSTEAG